MLDLAPGNEALSIGRDPGELAFLLDNPHRQAEPVNELELGLAALAGAR